MVSRKSMFNTQINKRYRVCAGCGGVSSREPIVNPTTDQIKFQQPIEIDGDYYCDGICAGKIAEIALSVIRPRAREER